MFWSLTPRQIEAHFGAARKRDRVDFNRTVEALFAIEKAKDGKTTLKDLLVDVDEKPRQQQTAEQRLAAASAWAAAMNRN